MWCAPLSIYSVFVRQWWRRIEQLAQITSNFSCVNNYFTLHSTLLSLCHFPYPSANVLVTAVYVASFSSLFDNPVKDPSIGDPTALLSQFHHDLNAKANNMTTVSINNWIAKSRASGSSLLPLCFQEVNSSWMYVYFFGIMSWSCIT